MDKTIKDSGTVYFAGNIHLKPAGDAMRVMRLKISFLLQLILCCILAVGCATKKYYYPHREIDRGVNAPEGARNLTAGGAMLLRRIPRV